MGGMIAPMPGIGPIGGRVAGDILTGGLAELMPESVQKPLYGGMGSLLFSPLSGLAAGGAGLMGAGGIGAGGMGAAAPPTASGAGLEGLAQFAVPGAAPQALAPTGAGSILPAGGAAGLSSLPGATANGTAGAASAPMSKSDMLQNAFLATSIGGMLGNALSPPPPPQMGSPSMHVSGGGGFTPVATGASQQWAQLMAQRRAQQTGKFTV